MTGDDMRTERYGGERKETRKLYRKQFLLSLGWLAVLAAAAFTAGIQLHLDWLAKVISYAAGAVFVTLNTASWSHIDKVRKSGVAYQPGDYSNRPKRSFSVEASSVGQVDTLMSAVAEKARLQSLGREGETGTWLFQKPGSWMRIRILLADAGTHVDVEVAGYYPLLLGADRGRTLTTVDKVAEDRKSTRLNSSHDELSRMPSSA